MGCGPYVPKNVDVDNAKNPEELSKALEEYCSILDKEIKLVYNKYYSNATIHDYNQKSNLYNIKHSLNKLVSIPINRKKYVNMYNDYIYGKTIDILNNTKNNPNQFYNSTTINTSIYKIK